LRRSESLYAVAGLAFPITAFATPVASCSGFLSVLTGGSLSSGAVTGDFGDVCVILNTADHVATVTFDVGVGSGFVAADAADVNTGSSSQSEIVHSNVKFPNLRVSGERFGWRCSVLTRQRTSAGTPARSQAKPA